MRTRCSSPFPGTTFQRPVEAGSRTINLFGASSADVQNAIRSLSTKKGFGELGQRFFRRFVSRFLNFYLSRVTAATLGGPRLRNLGDIAHFNKALGTHCDQSARIVRNFCGEWYSCFRDRTSRPHFQAWVIRSVWVHL